VTVAASLSPALGMPCPALTVVQSFRETYPKPPPAFMHTGRTPAALHARAGARCAGVGPEPGRDHPAARSTEGADEGAAPPKVG
jgi:hypothetical protein